MNNSSTQHSTNRYLLFYNAQLTIGLLCDCPHNAMKAVMRPLTNRIKAMQILNINRSRQITKRLDLSSSVHLCYLIDIWKTCKTEKCRRLTTLCIYQDELHKSWAVSKRQQFGRNQWLECYWDNSQLAYFSVVLKKHRLNVHYCRCTVDRLRRRNTGQHPGVGGVAVASKWFAGRHSAVRRISGRRRPWSYGERRLDQGVWSSAVKLALRGHTMQVTVLVAPANHVLFHVDSGRSLSWSVFICIKMQ